MATKITTGFSYNGKDPIDGPRSKFSSVSEMKNYNEAFIDEGHMSITNIGSAQAPVWKRFEWFSANTVDSTYGRWRAVTTEIPLASSSTIGGIKIGFDPYAAGHYPDVERPVELDNGKAFVAMLDATSSTRGVVCKKSYAAPAQIDYTDDDLVPTVKTVKGIADYAAEEAINTTVPTMVNTAVASAVPTAVTTAVNNKMWFGTKAQYDALASKDPNVLYFITY